MNPIWAGVVAGAAGTTALNAVTYLDMALRGRPPSSVPEEAVARLGDRLGIPIAPQEEQPDELRDKARNRQTALGALSGFATGLAVGALYGLLRSRRPGPPLSLASLLAGLGAMAFSDVPLTVFGLTDPREWGASGWASDLVPHLAYGACTALVFEALAE